MAVRPDLINAAGLLSGAATYALVDYCMGSTLWRRRPRRRASPPSRSRSTTSPRRPRARWCAGRSSTAATAGWRCSAARSTSDDARLLATAIGSYTIFPRRKVEPGRPATRPDRGHGGRLVQLGVHGRRLPNSTISSTRATGPSGRHHHAEHLSARRELADELEQHRDAARVDEGEAREVHDQPARRGSARAASMRVARGGRLGDVELAGDTGDHDLAPLLDLELRPDRSATATPPLRSARAAAAPGAVRSRRHLHAYP